VQQGVLNGLYTSEDLVLLPESSPMFKKVLALRGKDFTRAARISLASLYNNASARVGPICCMQLSRAGQEEEKEARGGDRC
jgi:hypothetical protein